MAPTIEDAFDDDTDLPLPNVPLPLSNTGPLLQELGDDAYRDGVGAFSAQFTGGTPGGSGREQQQQQPQPTVKDLTPYKTWSMIYPIYLDAKRPYSAGNRRVARAKALWWPLSRDIAEATNRLGLRTLHEVNKAHPRDWENPGRVRVRWRTESGALVNPGVTSKQQLLQLIAMQIQRLQPDNVPKPPFTPPVTWSSPAPTSKANKGKQPAGVKSPQHKIDGARVSDFSPAVESGLLVETVKAEVPVETAQAASTPTAGPAAGKGKKRVIRVRQ